ncbi:hypothetical protein EYF80_005377 [Liparis tanakae]|uniref:Uncharacterized protein n=1 Tax=Liparis tanakae TaxID=230148 RepID=A0A4Z2J3F5_9TELE|nr:hypothetical protein EYF80_005377 [Liparis tanakae]
MVKILRTLQVANNVMPSSVKKPLNSSPGYLTPLTLILSTGADSGKSEEIMQVYQKPPPAQTEAHTCLSCHRSPLGASTNTMLLEPAAGKGGWEAGRLGRTRTRENNSNGRRNLPAALRIIHHSLVVATVRSGKVDRCATYGMLSDLLLACLLARLPPLTWPAAARMRMHPRSIVIGGKNGAREAKLFLWQIQEPPPLPPLLPPRAGSHSHAACPVDGTSSQISMHA